jgi:hypothetical protein
VRSDKPGMELIRQEGTYQDKSGSEDDGLVSRSGAGIGMVSKEKKSGTVSIRDEIEHVTMPGARYQERSRRSHRQWEDNEDNPTSDRTEDESIGKGAIYNEEDSPLQNQISMPRQ